MPVGTNAVVAIYSGDTNYVGSTSSPLSQVVTPAVLTVTGNPASMTYGGAVPAFSATISGFVNGDTVSVVSGSPSLTINCSAGMIRKKVTPQPTCLFPVGSYPIVAAQGTLAAANYTFTFVNGTLTVTQASSTAALASSPNPSGVGQSVAFTASVAPATAGSNGLAPTGTVEFQANGADISGCSAVATTYGVAVCTTTALPVGSNAITAIYSGDSNYLTSTSTSLSQVVTAPALIPTATAFSVAAPNPATVGQTVTFTASVGPILTPAPTGTVTFLSGGAAISDCSTPVPLSSGMATCATTALTATAGAYSITAVYSGDSTYAGSTSPALTETVNTPVIVTAGTVTLTTTQPTLTAKAGDTLTAPVSVAVTGSIATVNLTCSVAPAGPLCAVSPASATSFPASAMVTITTTSSNASLHRGGGVWMFALMLPGLLLIPAGSRTVRRRAIWLLGGLLLLLTLSVAGCGGASTSSIYQVTVTGTDPVSGATGSTFIAVQLHK
ncbi:MAG: Ig-like domain repeat protein [Terriglobales bacterium]